MDIPILKYIDILIGLAVVMLLGTTVVAAVTQLLLSSLYFRARSLRIGLEELIRELDPSQFNAADSRLVAEMLLRHPLLARPSSPMGAVLNRLHNWVRRQRGLAPLPAANPTDVIQRSELVLLQMEWAANEGPLAQDTGLPAVQAGALRDKLRQVLVNNGIGDPAGVLRAVRLQAIENERNEPAQPAHSWWNRALLQEAASDWLGKVNHGFDNAMARVSQAFSLKARSITCAVSLLVVFSIQLDSLSLLRRLSVDDKLRDSLVKEAEMITARIEKAEAKDKPEAEKARAARAEIDATLALMREPRFALVPDKLVWDDPAGARRRLPGVLLSWILLSLGTPFWFNLLKNLLSLRSVLARKDDKERSDRESLLAPPKTAAPEVPPTARSVQPAGGEAGDLDATGAVG